MNQYCKHCKNDMAINLHSHWIDKGVKEYYQQCESCNEVYPTHLEDKEVMKLQDKQRKVADMLKKSRNEQRRENLIERFGEQKTLIFKRMEELESKYWK